jgi:hypothetical protein
VSSARAPSSSSSPPAKGGARAVFMDDLLERLRGAVGEDQAIDREAHVWSVVDILGSCGALERKARLFEGRYYQEAARR